MNELSYADLQAVLNEADLTGLPPLNISILRNVILEPITPYLQYLAYQVNLGGQIKFGAYDNIFQESVGGQKELLNAKTDCVLIFTMLEQLSWDLARNFPALSAEQVQTEVQRVEAYLSAVLVGIREQTPGMILWHGFMTPLHPAWGIWDSQSPQGQRATVAALNQFLQQHLKQQPQAYFVDLDACVGRLGEQNFYDARYWHIGRAPFTRAALAEIAQEDFKFIRALKGKNKKCLILDCDNVLWGGVVGEEGLAGIKLGKTYPGSAYYEFQQEILNLYQRGVIVGLCSKNNAAEVWEVFQQHPDMVLREKHIATAQINWQDKVSNLRQIATDLNIGLDSIVFVDDSEFEVNLVRELLPEVEVIQLPQGKAVTYRDRLASCGLFDTLTLSTEDKNRGAMYKAEVERKKLQAQTIDLLTYYRSLEMKVEIRFADAFAIPRLAQLTQKTNQFNLTTKRYSEADLVGFVAAAKTDVIYLRLYDRFGDSGIVGLCILRYEAQQAIFDTFLLSCRVLGRGVENVLLSQALKLATQRGCEVAVGAYYATSKNGQVEHFYAEQGFATQSVPSSGPTESVFHYRLGTRLPPAPQFIKEIVSEIEQIEVKQL